jgi:hypothetical protein
MSVQSEFGRNNNVLTFNSDRCLIHLIGITLYSLSPRGKVNFIFFSKVN